MTGTNSLASSAVIVRVTPFTASTFRYACDERGEAGSREQGGWLERCARQDGESDQGWQPWADEGGGAAGMLALTAPQTAKPTAHLVLGGLVKLDAEVGCAAAALLHEGGGNRHNGDICCCSIWLKQPAPSCSRTVPPQSCSIINHACAPHLSGSHAIVLTTCTRSHQAAPAYQIVHFRWINDHILPCVI